jgi:hypothetical protein
MGDAVGDRDRDLLRHFLAAIAYRTQKALRGAPAHYPAFSAGHRARTPSEILRHMTSVLGYSRTFFLGGTYPVKPDPLPDFGAEIGRFHDMVQSVGDLLASGAPLREVTPEQLLQGPFADVMTHAGQLALLRRLADDPVAPENFVYADVRRDRLGAEQALPARPDTHWAEAPTRTRRPVHELALFLAAVLTGSLIGLATAAVLARWAAAPTANNVALAVATTCTAATHARVAHTVSLRALLPRILVAAPCAYGAMRLAHVILAR